MPSPIGIDSETYLRSASRPLNWGISVADLPNRFLFFGAASISTTSNPNNISTVKWNGTSLGLHIAANNGSYSTNSRWQWWYLVDPEYGDYNLEFVYAHLTRAVNIHYMCLALYNVKQQAPRTGAADIGTGTGPISVAPTSVENDWVIDVSGLSNYNSSWTEQSSQIIEYNVWHSSGLGGIRGALGHKLAGAGGTTTMQWDPSGPTNKFGVCAAAIEGEAPGGPKMILAMSAIYDRIRENRKKLGIGDLGNFGLRDGLWKPKGGLATI